MTKESFDLHAIVNADGAVILDTNNGKLSSLNSTGAYIWEALRHGDSEDVIIARLATDTGEQPETIDQDVREFIVTLKEKQLLVC
jgi:Coenzyme PQQ synthesis protein D (PqqD)